MDKFDEIWKNRFNDSNSSQDDWNTPDDDIIWQAIIPHIQSQASWKKYLGLWLGLSMLVFGLFALYNLPVSSQLGLAQVETEDIAPILAFSNVDDSSSTQITEQQEADTKTIEVTPIKLEKPQNQIKRKSDLIEKNSTRGVASGQKEKPLSTGDNLIKGNQFRPDSWELEAALSASVIRTAFAEPGFLNAWNSASKLSKIQLLEAKMLQSEPSKLPSLNWSKFSSEKEPLSPAIGLNVGVVSWEPRINESYLSDLGPAEFYYTSDFGWLANLVVRIPLGKHWNIQTGLQFEQIQSFSGHNSTVDYDLTLEQNESNNTYIQNLATPYGLASANFQFDRIQNLNSTSVDLLVDIDSKHLIRNWSIPLGISYDLPTNMKTLQPALYLGIGVNYLSTISNTIKAIDTHHDSIVFDDSGPTSYAAPEINRWHYDARVGLGFEYSIVPTVRLNLNYSWLKGLSPIYQQNTHETRVNRHQLSFGLTKQLRKN